MKKRIAAVLLMTIGLAACGVVGTWPFTGPGWPGPMQGTLSGDTYVSQDRVFSVTVPFPADSAEYKQMRIKERRHPHEHYVSFGYGPPNVGFYRVDLAMRATPGSMQPSFDEIAHKSLAPTRKEIEQAYGTKTVVVESKKTEVNGRAAYYWELSQSVPAAFVDSKHPVTVEHDIYVINFQYAIATVWVQRVADASAVQIGMSPEQFAESLKLLPPATPASKKLTSDGTYRFEKYPVTVRSPAALCGIKNLYAYSNRVGVDFVAPDYLWQVAGDYFVHAMHIPSSIKDQKSFVRYVKKADKSFVPENSKPLGLLFKLTESKETLVNGLPAVQSMGVDEGKAVFVTTTVLHTSVLTIASLVYPLQADADPKDSVPWDCYNKFVSSVQEVNYVPQ